MQVVIVDYGLGNLFSVERALRYLGASCEITSDAAKISAAHRLILPGVGAFGDGMKGLAGRGLVEPIKEFIATGRPFMGICLGMQLLMTEGEEFGIHKGLDVIKGRVRRLDESGGYKIPHIGWNSLTPPGGRSESAWKGTVLQRLKSNSFVYFVHSNAVVPDDPSFCLASTSYGDNTFCSVVRKDNICGCQFHPERSADAGLDIYKEFILLQ
jgi:glutamine amidotransferase